MPAVLEQPISSNQVALSIEALSPKNGDKFSKNLYRWMKLHHHGRSDGRFEYNVYRVLPNTPLARTFGENTLLLGSLYQEYEGDKDLSAVRLYEVLCNGESTKTMCLVGGQLDVEEVRDFWHSYLKIGRCAIDTTHDRPFIDDHKRYTFTHDTRRCLWCGATHKKHLERVVTFNETWQHIPSKSHPLNFEHSSKLEILRYFGYTFERVPSSKSADEVIHAYIKDYPEDFSINVESMTEAINEAYQHLLFSIDHEQGLYVFPKTIYEMGISKFCDQYELVENVVTLDGWNMGSDNKNYGFATSPEDMKIVLNAKPHCVWTMVKSPDDNGTQIINGMHANQVLFYVITEKPWNPTESIVISDD